MYQLGSPLFTAKQDLTWHIVVIDSSSEAHKNSASTFCGQVLGSTLNQMDIQLTFQEESISSDDNLMSYGF